MRAISLLVLFMLSGCAVESPSRQASEDQHARTYLPCLLVPVCDAVIINAVSNEWVRPAGARNGLEVELMLELDPEGKLISAQIVRKSELESFDMSAVTAVLKAAPFTELQGLDEAKFARWYKKRRIIFRPEDLAR